MATFAVPYNREMESFGEYLDAIVEAAEITPGEPFYTTKYIPDLGELSVRIVTAPEQRE